MSCYISGCQNEADIFCEVCKTSSLFCLKDLNHPVKVISDDIIDSISKRSLKQEIKTKINQVLTQTGNCIEVIKKVSKEWIIKIRKIQNIEEVNSINSEYKKMSVLINIISSYNDDFDKFNQNNPIKHQIDIENFEAKIKELNLEITYLKKQNLALKENEALSDVVKKIEFENLSISEESQKLKIDLYDKVREIGQLQEKLSETQKKLRDLENERRKYKGK